MDSAYQNKLKEVKKFFKDSETSLNEYNQTISKEENGLIALDLDKDKVDTLLRSIALKEKTLIGVDKFLDDSLY